MLATLSRLWAAISRLTCSLDSLADTVDETNRGVRSQLALPGPGEPLALPAEVMAVARTAGSDPGVNLAAAFGADRGCSAETAPAIPENGRAKPRSRQR